jgi:Holliday junction resolvasome RuvABC DNA-binding subunit
MDSDCTTPPGYLTWDASLQANHTMIEKLEKHLYSLSEMGAVVNDDAFGASQGYEALQTRMTNAKLKCRRLSSKIKPSLQELISALTEIGYTKTEAKDIQITFKDGLPTNEYQKADIAQKEMLIKSRKTTLREVYGYSEKDAQKEIEQYQEENPSTPSFGSFGEQGGGQNVNE